MSMQYSEPRNPAGLQQHQSFSNFVSTHHGLVIGGGVVLVLVLAGAYMSSKNKTTPTTTATGDLSGLTNGVVYVPTSTSFSTTNERYGAFSNDPNLKTVTNSGNTTTTTTKTINPPPTVPPVHTGGGSDGGHVPPPPVPPPPTKGKGLIWDSGYVISGGETLSSIASKITFQLRQQGMPGSMSVTWHDLYAHNTNVINSTSAAHHNPIPGGPWNDIFPGERITVPRWG